MLCQNCNSNTNADAKFCHKCGEPLEEKQVQGSVETYFAKQTRGCQLCGSLAPTKNVEFNQNIGMIFARRYSSVKGRFCKKCINREFKKKTLTTLFLGWWSATSLIIAPFYLISNLVRFIPTIGMKHEEY
ncbi:MAG: zinc ribbon domain-containing protein [Candidatus Roizmanbacteria bacterium]|nr:zinc ribbon domain-containing protein [Candidatus Roizmanbacteria bacterium]